MKHIKRWNSEKYKGKTGVYRFSPIKTWGLIIMITFFVGLNIVHSQYKVIAELYYYSMQSPEETDRFIEDNQVLFDNQFFSHLAEVRETALIQAENNRQICDAIMDTRRKVECHQQNWAFGMVLWTLSIEQAIEEQTPWEETLGGQSAVSARQLCEFFGSCEMVEEVTRTIAQTLVIY